MLAFRKSLPKLPYHTKYTMRKGKLSDLFHCEFFKTEFLLCSSCCPSDGIVDQAGKELGDLMPLIPDCWV